MTEFRRVTGYAFADNETDPASNESALVAPEWSTCAFVDGRLASTFAAYPFRLRFDGETADAAGVTAVATLPHHRRKGLLRATMTRSFEEQRERGQSLAVLWASYGAIYQRFGYGPATNYVGYEFDPRWAGLHPGIESEGRIEVTTDWEAELPTLKQTYREHAAPRNLMLHRAEPMWRFGVCRAFDPKHRTHVAVYRNREDRVTGHLVYQLEASDKPMPNQKLVVVDRVAMDRDAEVGLWRFILSHDLVEKVEMGPVAEDDPMPLLVENPSKLGRRVGEGLFLRVVDVERALAARPYRDAGRMVVEIPSDPDCPWNTGAFTVEADGDERRVTRGAAAPDLALPPRSLASLLAGHSSATPLARAGLLDARDDATLRRADRMFATGYRPFCSNGF